MSRRVTLLLLTLWLSGCALLPAPEKAPELQLLPPDQGPAAQLYKQRVTLRTQGRQQQFLALIRQQPAQVQLVALMATGQRLLTLSYDGQQLQQQTLEAVTLPGAQILALLQLALWPPGSVTRAYPTDQGWQLTLDPYQRQLDYQGETVVQIRYQPARMVLDNRRDGYQVDVETLEQVPL